MKEAIPTRRRVLRTALAAACGLWVPLVLAEQSKPGMNQSAKPAPAAGKKVTQASVRYQTKPNGDQKCSTCANFIAESNTCKLVEGQISPSGWCALWTKKT